MSVARAFNNWVHYRQTVAQLDRLSARELRDLGVERGDIRRVARASAF